MNNESGQILIELVVAIGVFIVVVSVFAFLLFQSYEAGRLASEITKANFLAEEGLEAARSIRDNNWADLTTGDHGLDNSTGNWQFLGTQETIDGKFTRVVRVEEIDPDRKRVTSKVNWLFSEGRPQEIALVTYFTNWQKVSQGYCTGICTPCDQFTDVKFCLGQSGCSWNKRLKICTGSCTPCENFLDQSSCEAQSGCYWTWE